MNAKLTKNAITVLERRYLIKNKNGKITEKPEELFRRVANNIAQADKIYKKTEEEVKHTENEFYSMMVNLDFIPNSPTLMNAGRDLQQLSACFVLPIEDSMAEIFEAIKCGAIIHKSGGGTGYSFSRLRPAGDIVKSTSGVSSGPISFMRAFDAATETVKQGGTRRGANMAVLRIDHPDIREFINCKADMKTLTNFNISVAVTDKFMDAVIKNAGFNLINPHNNSVVETVKARDLFKEIIKNAHKNGDPGLLFIDEANRGNPVPHLGKYEATNPCGEQWLLPFEVCNLGHINLSNCVTNGKFNWNKLKDLIYKGIHFLDNVVDMNTYPLPQIEEMAKGTRRIGLGIMGWADVLIQLKIPYNSNEALELAEEVMKFIREKSIEKSEQLAEERGEFKLWKDSIWDTKYNKKIRNAALNTVAPTGTTAMIADCSGGIEPIFAIAYVKFCMDEDKLLYVNKHFERIAKEKGFYSKELMEKIADKGNIQNLTEIPEDIREIFVTSHDITPEWHIKMQAAFQKYNDSSISKTINFPNSATEKDIEEAYILAWKLKCKGITIYRDGSRDAQVLNIGTDLVENKDTEQYNISKDPRNRGKVTKGTTSKIGTGCGNLYVTINEDDQGPFELFGHLGKSGGCASAQTEAIGRLISLSLRSGINPKEIWEQVEGIRCPAPVWQPEGLVLSCPDAISKVFNRYLKAREKGIDIKSDKLVEDIPTLNKFMDNPKKIEKSEMNSKGTVVGICPECSGPLIYAEGCSNCKNCGFSKCG